MSRVLTPCLAASLLVLLAAAPAHSQPPGEPPPPPPPPAAAAAPDTTHFLPRWVRPWFELGGGWMSGPAAMRRHYVASQGLALGLEGRPSPRWALRAGLDYQMLVANSKTPIYYISEAGLESTSVQTQTTGWIGSVRAEAGARLAGDFWLTAGAGGGYMHSGLSGVETDLFTGYEVYPTDLVANGWGWLWTAALRYDFTPDPHVPLGIDVRTSSLQRRHESVQTWSVRLCYRVPAGKPSGAPRPPHR
jgi:hypothetical protein